MAGSDFDQLIAEAIGGEGFDENQIACIVGYVDIKDRSLLTLAELRDGLKRLIASGRVREVEHLRFAQGRDVSRHFSGIDQAEFEEAVGVYKHWLSARCEASRAQR